MYIIHYDGIVENNTSLFGTIQDGNWKGGGCDSETNSGVLKRSAEITGKSLKIN